MNKKGGEPSFSFVEFIPKKKSKGIVFYEDRITELLDSPHLARGAILVTPEKSVLKNILLVDNSINSGMVTPAARIRKPRALKLVAMKVKVEEKVEEKVEKKVEEKVEKIKLKVVNAKVIQSAEGNNFIVHSSLVEEEELKTQTPRPKRIKKESAVEAVQTLNFITPILESRKPRKQTRKIKSLEFGDVPNIIAKEEGSSTDLNVVVKEEHSFNVLHLENLSLDIISVVKNKKSEKNENENQNENQKNEFSIKTPRTTRSYKRKIVN